MSRRRGLRLRITLVAVVAVGLALGLGALVVISVLRSRLDTAATTAAQLRAQDVGALVRADALPSTLALPGEESAFVQVVDETSRVLASTNNIEGESPVSSLRADGDGAFVTDLLVLPLSDTQTMRVAVLDTATPDGIVTVYAGESLTNARATSAAVARLMLIGVPLLTAIAAAITWWAVGRTLRPVRDITTTMADITAHDLHRRVPVTSTDEIGELAMTVNDTLARLDTAVRTQRQFVADASHELRSPLAALRADLEVSTLHPTVTTWRDAALDMLGDVGRLQHLTDDLLLLARLDTQGPRPHTTVDLAPLVSNEIDSIQRAEITVTGAGLDVAHLVEGDAAQLRRMARNLLHNAETHAEHHISVILVATRTSVRLTVSDDGPGVPVDQRTAVFERFVRLDEARSRDAGGSGLGLAIVSDVVRAHHGTVTAENSELGGAAFAVELPRVLNHPSSTIVGSHSCVGERDGEAGPTEFGAGLDDDGAVMVGDDVSHDGEAEA